MIVLQCKNKAHTSDLQILQATNARVKPGYKQTATVLCNAFLSPFTTTVACFLLSAPTTWLIVTQGVM